MTINTEELDRIREAARRDDCRQSTISPSDVRRLVGEIDRLRALLAEARDSIYHLCNHDALNPNDVEHVFAQAYDRFARIDAALGGEA